MNKNFDDIYYQVNQQIKRSTDEVPEGFNPDHIETNKSRLIGNNSTPTVNNNSAFRWSVREGITNTTQSTPISRTVFTDQGLDYKSYNLDTTMGNISVNNIISSRLYHFSAVIDRIKPTAYTSLSVAWNGSMTLYKNNNILFSESFTGPDSRIIPLIIETGITRFDFMLIKNDQVDETNVYNPSNNNYFTIGNDIGEFADAWWDELYITPTPPASFTIKTELLP